MPSSAKKGKHVQKCVIPKIGKMNENEENDMLASFCFLTGQSKNTKSLIYFTQKS